MVKLTTGQKKLLLALTKLSKEKTLITKLVTWRKKYEVWNNGYKAVSLSEILQLSHSIEELPAIVEKIVETLVLDLCMGLAPTKDVDQANVLTSIITSSIIQYKASQMSITALAHCFSLMIAKEGPYRGRDNIYFNPHQVQGAISQYIQYRKELLKHKEESHVEKFDSPTALNWDQLMGTNTGKNILDLAKKLNFLKGDPIRATMLQNMRKKDRERFDQLAAEYNNTISKQGETSET